MPRSERASKSRVYATASPMRKDWMTPIGRKSCDWPDVSKRCDATFSRPTVKDLRYLDVVCELDPNSRGEHGASGGMISWLRDTRKAINSISTPMPLSVNLTNFRPGETQEHSIQRQRTAEVFAPGTHPRGALPHASAKKLTTRRYTLLAGLNRK